MAAIFHGLLKMVNKFNTIEFSEGTGSNRWGRHSDFLASMQPFTIYSIWVVTWYQPAITEVSGKVRSVSGEWL